MLLTFAIRIYPVQTFIAKKTAAYLSNELQAEIKIEAVEIIFFNQVILKEFSIKDQEKKTLLDMRETHVTMRQFALFSDPLNIKKIKLNDGEVNISRHPLTGEYNFQFLADYFEQPEDPDAEPKVLGIDDIVFSNVDFNYDDNREPEKEFGIDYNHIGLTNIDLNIKNFKMADDTYSFDLKNLSCTERSGIELKGFSSSVFLKEGEIKLDAMALNLGGSSLLAEYLSLNFNSWDDFDSFEDRVKFNMKLDSSIVSLEDIAFFVSDLKGMNDVVGLQGNFTDAISQLKIKDFVLGFGQESFVRGDFQLPDFSDSVTQEFTQFFSDIYINFEDLKAINMPDSIDPISLDPSIEMNKYLAVSNLTITGSDQDFDFTFDEFKSDLGVLNLPGSMNFLMDSSSIKIAPSNDYTTNLFIKDFHLGRFLSEDLLGNISGSIQPIVEISNKGDVSFKLNRSNISNVDFNDYNISQIDILEGSFKNNLLKASIKINDENLILDMSCDIILGSRQQITGELNIEMANLDALNFTSDSSVVSTSMNIAINETKKSQYEGDLVVSNIDYYRGIDTLFIPLSTISILNSPVYEHYTLKSDIVDLEIKGVFDWENLLDDFTDDLAKVFPSIMVGGKHTKEKSKNSLYNDITFNLLTKDMENVFGFFAPELEIQNETGLSGKYNSKVEYLDIVFRSPYMSYGDVIIKDIYGTQSISNDSIYCDYVVEYMTYNDSLKFNQIEFVTDGTNGVLNSNLSWAPSTEEESSINWDTRIYDNDHLEVILKPSFFSLDGRSWSIVNESDISITSEDVHISKFELRREDQLIELNGCLSENDFDELRAQFDNIDLSEIGLILGLENQLTGKLSGWGALSNPYSNLQYMGDLSLNGFYVDEHEIGDLLVQTNWDGESRGVILQGELDVNNIQTFNFSGSYMLESDSLDLYLDFDDTDISFVNAFIDPTEVSEIAGTLNGRVRLDGKINEPKLKGNLFVNNAQAKLELLGVKYYLDGSIEVFEDLFALNSVPLRDEEGNTGSVIGSIFHENFSNWNFDVQVNFEDDISSRKQTFPFTLEPLNQFLILNTSYQDGDVYYGKAYGRGTANISGYANNMSITLDVETREGTKINFPMYGISEIEEDFDFVSFLSDSISQSINDDKTDLTGLDIDLNFRVTPSANVKIIFDPDIGDQIVATGSGDLNMTLDQYNEINLTGNYEISGDSKYNFAMGIIKQDFDIESGSSLTWTGDPYDANIDLVTSFRMKKVSLVDLSPEQIDNSLTSQEIICYLNLDETLLKPEISFDIKSPNAPETGKGLIERVVNDEDELSRQFFSLLLLRKFQPLKGTITAGGSAAIDVAESQINALLGQVSQNYDLNVNSALDEVFGETSLEFGVSKSFLEDRLIISGSFGIENKADFDAQQEEDGFKAGFIGDVFVEYLINQSGTFRATAFNQSNSNTLNENAGAFTQGAGLSYHEDFNNAKDFKLLQYFFDIFRPKNKKKYPIKRKKKQTRIE
ncbi:MAG: translocation/assembly module TamB domain-containing protein [Crocinitomicaceae bacterium]|nr:translocation/assembly module TamB domain-containing protein [Crocinitomicaceae bacterium]